MKYIRFFDIIFSLILLIILIPVYFIVSVFVFSFSGFPVFYHQKRMGKNKKIFTLYKFRTMIINAEKCQKKGTDTNKLITFPGCIIRKIYLDELPQLFNILKGNMSFIGPRPYGVKEFKKLNSVYNIEDILAVRPGLTGLESALDYLPKNKSRNILKKLGIKANYKSFIEHKIVINKYYMHYKSFFLNIKIIYWTILSFIYNVVLLFEKLFK